MVDQSIPYSLKGRRDTAFVLALLAAATLAAYAPIFWCDFVNFDDGRYLTENKEVQRGLSLEGIRWAFQATPTGNWYPLTWISHMACVSVFGLNPWGHHFTNLALHITNACLLFLLMRRFTAAFWPSAAVAFLFALHPLGVESVAWVAERKNVLSTFFWFAALWAYAAYSEKKSPMLYLLTTGLFCLGLLAKSMLVTLPFVFLLMDYWPSKRMWPKDGEGVASRAFALVLEKVPWFIVSGVAAYVALAVKEGAGNILSARYSLAIRLGNACLGYLFYLEKMVVPRGLGPFYPHPGTVNAFYALGAFSGLVFLTIVFVVLRVKRPYLIVGWLWFLGTLIPVIGLVQVGGQAYADRYAYGTMVGLFIAVVWTVAEFIRRYPMVRVLSLVAFLTLGILTWGQTLHWRTSETLFLRALAVTDCNSLAHNNLGMHYNLEKDWPRAGRHFEAAVLCDGTNVIARTNLGAYYMREGDFEEAKKHLKEAIRLRPGYVQAYSVLGGVYVEENDPALALKPLNFGLRYDPDHVLLLTQLSDALMALSRMEEAIGHLEHCLAVAPESVGCTTNMGNALLQRGKTAEATEYFRRVTELDPDSAVAHLNMGKVLMIQERSGEAEGSFRRTLILDPESFDACYNLAVILVGRRAYAEAGDLLEQAVAISPEHVAAKRFLTRVRRFERELPTP